MYQIRMKKNEDFGEKQCFLSRESFKLGRVIVTLEKKGNGRFKPVGFINPLEIKECQTSSANLDDVSFDEQSKACFFLESKIIFFDEQISDREKKVEFLKSIISDLEDEVMGYKKWRAEIHSVMNGVDNTNFRFPTWKEYLAVLKEGGAR
jgi:hypothetical protein